MSRKDKSLHEKVKQFFSKKEAVPINFEKFRKEPYVISSDILKNLSSENPQSLRLKTIKELYDIVLTKRLEDYAVETLCKNVEDLINVHNSIDTRHIVFQFYCALINGQNYQRFKSCSSATILALAAIACLYLKQQNSRFVANLDKLEHMTVMRTYLFKILATHNILEDTLPRLEMLKALSEDGKIVSNFEEEIGPFLLSWFPEIMATGKTAEFLRLITNVIKFNAAYLDDEIIAGFIKSTCDLCTRTKAEEDIQESLNVLGAVLCYSHLPSYVLQCFISTLCLTVNVEKFSQCSWKQMRNLLGTSVGHTSILTLCLILQNKENYKEASLVRGAVFFIGMALWGSHRVSSLTHPPTAVLPSFLKVLESNDSIIAYEIVLSLQRLVKRNGEEPLRNLCWDMIFDIIEEVLKHPELQGNNQAVSVLGKAVHDLITAAEENCPQVSSDRLFRIIAKCADARNDQSVIRLILHNAESISPYKPDFLVKMNMLMEKHFRNEKRSSVQLEVLKVIKQVRCSSGHIFEDDLMDQNILQNMSHLDSIHDVNVRKTAVELLIEIAESCMGSWFFDILEAIEKIMKRMFEHLLNPSQALDGSLSKESFYDVLTAVDGLIKVFKKKLLVLPSNQCVEIYDLLINHIQQHYNRLSYLDEVVKIRKSIFEFLLQFRANNQKQLGICMDGSVEYSVYISCDSSSNKELHETAPASPSPGSPSSLVAQTISYLSYNKAFQSLIMCLKEEKDWEILELILKELPKLLQNKALILRGSCNLAALCIALRAMVNDRTMGFPESLKNAPPRLTRTDVQSNVYPSVSAVTSYHSCLESHIQRMLIQCLQSGLVSRSAKICMEGLTLCTLEMQNSMIKLLPDVLLKLSKISATVGVSVSVLEFLSNLIRLPHLYVSFVEDQYMSIFAIALPYTNPFKFSQYTVALAHHVIAMWFLKCRIPFRRDFAKFITKGLRSNLNVPRDDSSRPTSSSRNDELARNSEDKSLEKQEMSSSAIIALHTELMETGLDLMARFTFGMSSNVPKRSPVSEFLLEKGQKSSWLVGNKIITITTSGCGTKSFKHGLCEQCYSSCHDKCKSIESDENDSIFLEHPVHESQQEISSKRDSENSFFERKRHRSAIQRRNTTLSRELLTSTKQTKDDILLHYQRFESSDPNNRFQTSYLNNDENHFSHFQADWTSENKGKEDKSNHLCSCWCSSWAEVHIRRPTGNTSWMMKMQNHLFLPSAPPDIPLSVLTSLVLPQKIEDQDADDYFLSSTEDDVLAAESELKEVSCDRGGIEISPCPKSNPPMRRTNSSPDMNTSWSNFQPLMQEERKESFESSVESNQDQLENLTIGSTMEFPSKKDEREGVQSSKPSLKLDLSRTKTGKLKSLNFRSDSLNSAPIEKLLNNNSEPQNVVSGSFRDRGHTISVMSPIRPVGSEKSVMKPDVNRRSGMSPSFVFLQLFHDSYFGPPAHKPLLLLPTETNNRALNVLDHTPPYDTHKIGVVYVGPGQVDKEVAILSNVYGSARYVNFLHGLGSLVRLTDVDPHTTYLGGLDTKGEDGKFALIWQDDVMQVVFHVATLMLNKESDKMRNEKKKHIANDNVIIVYNESGEDYKLSTIKGHVTNACVVIHPEDFNSNVVLVKLKTKELQDMFGHTESYIVSDESLPVFVRQLALHANLASLIMSRRQHSAKYSHVSNWLERLRTIKRLRAKVVEELKSKAENLGFESFSDSSNFDDFTDYV